MSKNISEYKKILLVGLGRMGQRYLNFLTTKFSDSEIYVVDIKIKQSSYNGFPLTQIKNLNDIEKELNEFDLIIDAATTGGRLERINFFKKFEKQVFLEKPIFAFRDVENYNSYLPDQSVAKQFSVNYPWQHSRFHKFLRSIYEKKLIGKLTGIHFNCGAVGWSNIGSHNLAIFKYITGDLPSIIYAKLQKQIVTNPRGKEFIDFDGMVIGETKSGINFTHSSFASSGIGIVENYIFENGYVIYDRVSGHYTLARRPKKLNHNFARYGNYKSVIQGTSKTINIQDLLENHLMAFLKKTEFFSLYDAVDIALIVGSAIKMSSLDLHILNGYELV